MAIKCKQGTNTTETVSGIILTGTTPQINDSATYYYGTTTHTFANEVKYVNLDSNTTGVWFTISGSSVIFKYSASTSGARATYTATVVHGLPDVTVTDIKATSGKAINYVNVSSDPSKYIWTRPTTFYMELDWDYFKSWSLKRVDGSKSVDSVVGTIKSNSSLSTSGTTRYTLPTSDGIRYGDKLNFTYTLKPGATMSLGSSGSYAVTVDPTFGITNHTGGSSGEFPDPIVTFIEGPCPFTKWVGTRDAMDYCKNRRSEGKDCATFTIKVEKPSSLSGVPVDVYMEEGFFEECYYTKNKLSHGWETSISTKTYCSIQVNGKTLSSSLIYIGSIAANTSSATYTAKMISDESDVTLTWPKYASVLVQINSTNNSAHKYTTNSSQAAESEGTHTTGGDNTGSYPAGS